jgi:ABC-type antimicrobial peptide transport system permease subunit
VKIPDLAELALRNLRESLLRNSLTTLGISVGVASLVAMLSLGIGLQQMFSKRLAKSGLFDTVLVTSRRNQGGMGRDRSDGGPTPGESRILDEPARQEIERLPNVLEAYPDIRFRTELRYDGKLHGEIISALPSSAKSNDAFEGMQGSFFSSDTAAEVILQKPFAEELLGKIPARGGDEANVADLAKPLLGKELTMLYSQRAASSTPTPTPSPDAAASADADILGASYSVVSRELKLKIVGISDQDPESMRGPTRAKVFLPLKLAESLHVMQPVDLSDVSRAASDQPVYSSISVRVKNPAQVQQVEDAVKKMGFGTFSILDASRGLQLVFRVLYAFLGVFGSLALIVASIGIVNTLVMAILERRREIGIMKAIGARRGDIFQLIWLETLMICLLGSVIGSVFAWFGAGLVERAIKSLADFGVSGSIVLITPGVVGYAILGSAVLGFFAGLYPAWRAASLMPVESIREGA